MPQLFKIYANGNLYFYRERGKDIERLTAAEFVSIVAECGLKLTGFAAEYGHRLLVYTYSKTTFT